MSREIYERGGWTDGRLGMAYDLVAEALSAVEDSNVKQILAAIEKADIDLTKATENQ